jgi:Tol biopolymer transport system component
MKTELKSLQRDLYSGRPTLPHRRKALAGLAALLASGIGTVIAIRKGPARRAFEQMKMSRLTSHGTAVSAAISSDSRYVVYAQDDAGRQSLWIREVAVNSSVEIVPASNVNYWRLKFSPDNNFIYYSAVEGYFVTLYRIPTLGGIPEKVLFDVDSGVTFSPDGKQFAFARHATAIGEDRILIAHVDRTQESVIAFRKQPSFFLTSLAWSPDGSRIVCAAGGLQPQAYANLVEISPLGGPVKPIGTRHWFDVETVEWLHEGDGLVATVSESSDGPSQVWGISYPSGEWYRITNDLSEYSSVNVTADSASLVSLKADRQAAVWIAPQGDAAFAQQMTKGGTGADGAMGISCAPDGRIVYTSLTGGASDIWIMAGDGTNPRQLTANTRSNITPRVSADGRFIVFVSDRTGLKHIWRMDMDGNNVVQLTSEAEEQYVECSPDSQWILYTSTASGKQRLWKTPISGGKAVKLTDTHGVWPAVSPDGKLIAFFYRDEQADPRQGIAIMPFAGGPPLERFPLTRAIVRWSHDGTALLYIQHGNGRSNIWMQPINGGPARQVTDFKSGRFFWAEWSRDGTLLTLSRGDVSRDVVLISDLKST